MHGLFAIVGGLLLLGSALPFDDPVQRGVTAYEKGHYEQACQLLRPVFRENPARVHPEHGAVAFWLGKAYGAREQPDSLRRVWKKGVTALQARDRVDVRLFDSFLWHRWGEGMSSHRLDEVYLSLLRQVGDRPDGGEGQIVRRHVAQLRPLLSDAQRRNVFVAPEEESPMQWTFRETAGSWLVRWWRRQDPIPATVANERVEEHLARVAHARAHFSYDERLAGWDERGDLYVRYGPPDRQHEIPFHDLGFLQEVVRFGVGVGRGDFPKNEIWRYPSVGQKGDYLFVERKTGGYRLGKATDLLPSELKRQFHAVDRSQNRAYSSLAALRYIYEHLSMHYRDPGNVYSDLIAYFNSQEHMAAIDNLRGGDGGATVGAGTGERRIHTGPGASRRTPSTVANQSVQKSDSHERNFIRKREKEMPQSHTALSQPSELPIEMRVARFLEEDGTTATEVYWGLSPTGEEPSESDGANSMIRLSAVRYDEQYRRDETHTKRHRVQTPPSPTTGNRVRGRVTVEGASPVYHLALQWDRFEGPSPDEERAQEESRGRKTVRLDSLRPLNRDPAQLEMSDVRLMTVPTEGAFSVDQAVPYPARSAHPTVPLALYFEVYHLTYGTDDRTKYTVEYRVEREEEKGFWGRLFGRERRQTGTTTSYSSPQRRTQEYILLDWGGAVEGPQSATVTVRVTDEVSGQQVERDLDVRLVPQDSSS